MDLILKNTEFNVWFVQKCLKDKFLYFLPKEAIRNLLQKQQIIGIVGVGIIIFSIKNNTLTIKVSKVLPLYINNKVYGYLYNYFLTNYKFDKIVVSVISTNITKINILIKQGFVLYKTIKSKKHSINSYVKYINTKNGEFLWN